MGDFIPSVKHQLDEPIYCQIYLTGILCRWSLNNVTVSLFRTKMTIPHHSAFIFCFDTLSVVYLIYINRWRSSLKETFFSWTNSEVSKQCHPSETLVFHFEFAQSCTVHNKHADYPIPKQESIPSEWVPAAWKL